MALPWTKIVAVAFVALAAVLRFTGLAALCLNGDEIFSIITVRYGWDHFAIEVVKDAIHPPLFYLLLRGWIAAGGEVLSWVRLFPAIASALALVPLWLLCRELDVSRPARLTAFGLFAVNPYLLQYAKHVRMYSLLMLLTVTALWLCARLLRGNAGRPLWLWWFVVNLAMIYTQYYGWVVLGLQLVILFFWRPGMRRRVALSGAAFVLLFAPWAWLAAGALAKKGGAEENLGWIDRPGWSEFLWYFVDLCGFTTIPDAGTTIVGVALALLLGILLRALRFGSDWQNAGRFAFVACFALVPPALAFLASQVAPQSVWGHRHLIVSAVPFILFCAMSIDLVPRWPVKAALGAVAAVWICFAFLTLTADRHEKVPWDALVLDILQREPATAKVPLHAIGPHLHFPLWFFLEEWKMRQTSLMAIELPANLDAAALARKAENIEVRPSQGLPSAEPGRQWVVYTSASWPEHAPPRDLLARQGCTAGPESTSRDWYQTVFAFPVTCPPR